MAEPVHHASAKDQLLFLFAILIVGLLIVGGVYLFGTPELKASLLKSIQSSFETIRMVNIRTR